jgi:hypothetical protein
MSVGTSACGTITGSVDAGAAGSNELLVMDTERGIDVLFARV